MSQNFSLSSVIGLQFGDEGKGQLVDYLTQQHDIIVRYNGGANAGHSVRVGDRKFVLHQTPVGCISAGKIGVLGNGVALHVPSFLDELAQLKDVGVTDYQLKIAHNAHLVMPYHFIEESLRQTLAVQVGNEPIGTTAKGIGPCYADKASRDTGIRVADLYEPETLKRRLAFIVALKNNTLSSLAATIGESYTPYSVEPLFEECMAWAESLKDFATNASLYLLDQEQAGSRILFEGANASKLDIDFGDYPYVTSSNGSNLGMTAGSGFLPDSEIQRFGVIKTYTSRVGNGPFPTELFGELADEIRNKGKEFGSTTERPRRIGWLDLPSLAETVRMNRANKLVLTGLFVLAQLEEFYVCTGYENGEAILQRFEVSGDFQNAASELPVWCADLIALIESRLAPVAAICIGPNRDQLIWRR
ncbi:adenylosuccinate synthetase [Leucothrix arctica]|uniref:Adenylosuccinate synthetase n=1 Tax=Leucothrix arctica TaxID=1481894 RepID=A0A317CP59_9GAMM|nr:adenylosuccinate synthetase [Leucothrix arctica]PWQ98130.1 adenylosuccinate synthase [Leucothrix arctica]